MTSPRADDVLADGLTRSRVSPAGPWFHLALVVPTAVLLWAESAPAGGSLLVWIVGGSAVAVAAVAWAMRALAWAVARRHDGADGSPWWFAVAPVAALVVAGLFVADVPLRARFDAARPAFDRLVDEAPVAGPDQVIPFDAPRRAGTYRIATAERVGDDVFVTVSSPLSGRGVFLVDAGFAFVPGGPTPTTFPGGEPQERIDFEPLGGGWYVWSTYW